MDAEREDDPSVCKAYKLQIHLSTYLHLKNIVTSSSHRANRPPQRHLNRFAQDRSPSVSSFRLARVLFAVHDNLGAALASGLLINHIHDAGNMLMYVVSNYSPAVQQPFRLSRMLSYISTSPPGLLACENRVSTVIDHGMYWYASNKAGSVAKPMREN